VQNPSRTDSSRTCNPTTLQKMEGRVRCLIDGLRNRDRAPYVLLLFLFVSKAHTLVPSLVTKNPAQTVPVRRDSIQQAVASSMSMWAR
jgi:hypothetical protein